MKHLLIDGVERALCILLLYIPTTLLSLHFSKLCVLTTPQVVDLQFAEFGFPQVVGHKLQSGEHVKFTEVQ